jgi:hypothetical protein
MGSDQFWTALVLALVGGLGLGTIAATLIQQIYMRRAKTEETRFAIRREAFANLLAAISRLDKLRGDTTADIEAEYALCVAQVELVASKKTLERLKTWRDFEPGTPERDASVASLLDAMRRDLAIAKDSS